MLHPSREIQKIQQRKKLPRNFLLPIELLKPIRGLEVQLPSRDRLPVLDIGLSGIVVDATGFLSSFKLGQGMDCWLRVSGMNQPIPVLLTVFQIKTPTVGLFVESFSSSMRIVINQNSKDQISIESLCELPSNDGGRWWHGSFDTNLLYWTQPTSSVVARAIIEYDGILFQMKEDSWWMQKSIPVSEAVRGYSGLWHEKSEQKISFGASWKERLLRLLKDNGRPELLPFQQILLNTKL